MIALSTTPKRRTHIHVYTITRFANKQMKASKTISMHEKRVQREPVHATHTDAPAIKDETEHRCSSAHENDEPVQRYVNDGARKTTKVRHAEFSKS